MIPRSPCPTCRREIAWTEEFPFRPFCSERCRLIDLGAWLTTGQRAIAGEGSHEVTDESGPAVPADSELDLPPAR